MQCYCYISVVVNSNSILLNIYCSIFYVHEVTFLCKPAVLVRVSGLVTITVNMAATNTASLVECCIIISNDQKTNYNYLNLACFVAIILALINYVMSSETLPAHNIQGRKTCYHTFAFPNVCLRLWYFFC